MTDIQIASSIDFIPTSGLGRGGFEVLLSLCPIMYDDNSILKSLSGNYINPLGPFHKSVNLNCMVITLENEYNLYFRTKFWESCSEQEFIRKYLIPFLNILRRIVSGYEDCNDVRQLHPGFECTKRNLEEFEKKYINKRVNALR